MEITEEFDKKLKEWSEGNEYLYSLLCFCWEKSIKTVACCAGHDKHPNPYISFVLDEESIYFLKSIIALLESVNDIAISCDYRRHSNNDFNDGVSDDLRKSVTIYCQMHNRCEVFFKIACAINGLPKEISTEKGKTFYKQAQQFLSMTHEEIKMYIKEGIVVGSSMSTVTEDFRRYLDYKREILYRNAFLKLFSKKARELNRKYGDKYPTQDEYSNYSQSRK